MNVYNGPPMPSVQPSSGLLVAGETGPVVPLIDRVRDVVRGTPFELWPREVAKLVQAGTFEFEAHGVVKTLQEELTPCSTPQKVHRRLPPRTRRDRWEERPVLPCGRWVHQISLDPALDWTLSDGANRCLQLVVSLSGGAGRSLKTLTSSIATQLGRTRRTVQNYWNELADAGYITRTFDRKSGHVTISVTDLVKPRPMPEVKKPWPRMPSPMAGWKRPQRGGAKFASHIKAKSTNRTLLADSVLVAEAYFRPG
jgi:hypothetical protein